MSSKYTAGPWQVRGSSENSNGAILILAPEKENGWSSVIAKVVLTDADTLGSAAANAHLIAAAPEMFEALMDLIHGLRIGYFRNTNEEAHKNYADGIEAVIIKARGGK